MSRHISTPCALSAVARRRFAAGVVLPIVLVILTVLTGLVVTQIRRSTIDERLAANTRETVCLTALFRLRCAGAKRESLRLRMTP